MRRNVLIRSARILVVAVAPACVELPARAADTLEVFPIALLELEYQLGYQGIGSAGAYTLEAAIGVGLTPRLSSYLQLSTKTDGGFERALGGIALGALFSAVSTDRFGLDLFFDSGVNAPRLRPSLKTGLEINWDSETPQLRRGLYLRLTLDASAKIGLDVQLVRSPALRPRAEALLGGYVTRSGRHRLLLEYELSAGQAFPSTPTITTGTILLGYNVMLSRPFEVRGQLYLNLPGSNARWSVGLSCGFITRLKLRR